MARAANTSTGAHSLRGLSTPLKNLALISAAIFVGIAGGVLTYIGAEMSIAVPPALMIAIPAGLIAVWRPRIGMLGFLFLVLFMEEFPGGISEDDVTRSERTLFYAMALGLPAVYLPDLMIAGLLFLYLVKFVVKKEHIPLQCDKIGFGLLMVFGSLILSIMISYGGEETFGPVVLGTTLGFFEDIELPDNIARLISILQIKLFILVFPSYLLGLFFFREERDLRHALWVFTAAMTATALMALARLASNPGMVVQMTTVIVDTSSVWLLALASFYMISLWTLGYYRGWGTTLRVLGCSLFIVLILLSFRRTIWGAMAMAALFWPLILPRRGWGKLLFLIAAGIIAMGLFFTITPVGRVILASVIARMGETNLAQGSTLYRFAMMVWFFENIWDLPFFGYGLRPLWDVTIQIRLFLVNMESVHSLYLWILLRMGIFGILCWIVASYLVISRIKDVYLLLYDEKGKILAGVILLSLVMFFFNGITNPVYGQVRHMILLGLELALITRLPYMLRSKLNSDP